MLRVHAGLGMPGCVIDSLEKKRMGIMFKMEGNGHFREGLLGTATCRAGRQRGRVAQSDSCT